MIEFSATSALSGSDSCCACIPKLFISRVRIVMEMEVAQRCFSLCIYV